LKYALTNRLAGEKSSCNGARSGAPEVIQSLHQNLGVAHILGSTDANHSSDC
jgi:hypothetical protein